MVPSSHLHRLLPLPLRQLKVGGLILNELLKGVMTICCSGSEWLKSCELRNRLLMINSTWRCRFYSNGIQNEKLYCNSFIFGEGSAAVSNCVYISDRKTALKPDFCSLKLFMSIRSLVHTTVMIYYVCNFFILIFTHNLL